MLNNEIKVVIKNINELNPYEKNPRKNDQAVDYVANSIKEFGFKVPIVIDSENVIIAGHTRYKASKKLGLQSVPCIVADDLTPEQVKAYRLADNKVAEKAEWDFELLNDELDELLNFDMTDFGFDEVIPFDDSEVEANKNEPDFEKESKQECTCPQCGLRFVPIMED